MLVEHRLYRLYLWVEGERVNEIETNRGSVGMMEGVKERG